MSNTVNPPYLFQEILLSKNAFFIQLHMFSLDSKLFSIITSRVNYVHFVCISYSYGLINV